MRYGKVVGPVEDVEEARRPLARVGAGVEGAVVRYRVDTQTSDLAVLGRRDFGHHVIVTREGRGREVLDAVLHPLSRASSDDRSDDSANIARVSADLVAKAAADVGGDDVDLVLGDFRDQRGDRADDVRRLEGAPQRQLALDLVEGGDRLAGL